jgi:hypothetical protein
METNNPREELKRLHKRTAEIIKDSARHLSAARLLAENEPFGELVMLSLLDDELAYSGLWYYLKSVSDWLKETEERYRSQFPGDKPKTGIRFDLSSKPAGFKSRLEIFRAIAEKAESSKLWKTELILNDPVAVVKRFQRQ